MIQFIWDRTGNRTSRRYECGDRGESSTKKVIKSNMTLLLMVKGDKENQQDDYWWK